MSAIGTKSIDFDGSNDQIVVGDIAALNFNALTQSFSGVCWCRNTTGADGWRTLFQKYDDVSAAGWLLRMGSNESLHFGAYGTGTDIVQAYCDEPNLMKLWTGWLMAGFSYDHTTHTIKLYLNGVEPAQTITQDDLATSTATTGSFIIGARAATDYWFGRLHGAMVYSGVLSAADFEWLFNGGAGNDPLDGGAPSGLIAYWPLGEGDTYPTASDLGGSNYDGTMTNMDSGDIVTDSPQALVMEEPPDILAGAYPIEREMVPGEFGDLLVQMEDPPNILEGAYPIERALLFTPEEEVPDTTAPVIDNFSPPVGTGLSPHQPVSFDVTDDSGELRRVIVHAVFADGVAEVVHDGTDWRGYYRVGCSRVLIEGGWRYTVLREGGWPSGPNFNIFAIDASGNEAA